MKTRLLPKKNRLEKAQACLELKKSSHSNFTPSLKTSTQRKLETNFSRRVTKLKSLTQAVLISGWLDACHVAQKSDLCDTRVWRKTTKGKYIIVWMFNLEWLSRGRWEVDLFRLINYQFKSAEVKAKRVVLTIPNIPPFPRINEKCKHLLKYPWYSQYLKSAQSSLKLKLRTLNTYPTFCFQYRRGTDNKGFNATKESVYFRKEFNSHRTGLRN